jgi:tetratricopeptide (TPR) repeat protein
MVEDTMFFPKIRAHAKWVFVLLAVVFASSFIFLGVGSGSSGIGDLLNGNFGSLFGGGSTSSATVKKDQARIAKNPKDYAAYKDLAAAQAAAGKLDDAIATLGQLKALRPKDIDGLTQLAGLYLQKADIARNEAIAVQSQTQNVVSPSTFAPGGTTSPLGKAYQSFSNPVAGAIQTQASSKLNAAYSKLTTAYSQAVVAYQAVAAVSPNDPSVQFALAQTAEQAQDTPDAIKAYKRFLKLAPEDPTAPAIRQRLKQLKQTQTQQPSVSTG